MTVVSGNNMRLSLITKLIIFTSLILVAFMALFAYVNLKELRHLFLEESATDIDKLSETIIKTTHYQMLINDLPRVFDMIREVGTQESIRQIRLISKSGRIIFSTNENEIGTLLENKSDLLNMFDPSQQPFAKENQPEQKPAFLRQQRKTAHGACQGYL